MAELFRNTYANIDLAAVKHNYLLLESLGGENKFICPMIKSFAYGHGDINIAKTLEEAGALCLGVALVEEALRLRKNNIKKAEILVFGMLRAEAIKYYLDFKLTPVISSIYEYELLKSKLSKGQKLPIHLKFNTGMNRRGLSVTSAKEVARELAYSTQFELKGICTHFSDAEDAHSEKGRTAEQLNVFSKVEKIFGKEQSYHALNSAAILASELNPGLKRWGSRPGIALYGSKPVLLGTDPRQEQVLSKINFKPVMSLQSEVISYNHVKKSERVSYGGRWTAMTDSIIGVVPIGYADGYHRLLSNKGFMLFRQQKVPVVGTVCMDYVLVDLTLVLGGQVGEIGEKIILFGQQGKVKITVDEVAESAQTISYEILVGLGRRVPRRYI